MGWKARPGRRRRVVLMTDLKETDRTARPFFDPRLAPVVAVAAFCLSRAVLVFLAVAVGRDTGLAGLGATVRWDAQRYVDLATNGYALDPAGHWAAMFPGLPLLLRALNGLGLSYALAGCLVSTVGSAVVCWGLYRLVRGGVAGAMAVLAWCFAPVAVFTFVPYTESLFLALALWAWLKARDGEWHWAALLAAGSCLFRVSGLFLVGALALMAVFGAGRAERPSGVLAVGRRLVWLVLPVGVLFAFLLYEKVHFGTWTAWLDAQESGWNRSFHWPWDAFTNTVDAVRVGGADTWVFKAEIAAVGIGLAVTVWSLVRRRLAEAGWVGVHVGVYSVGYWFMTVPRSGLLWFPLWATIGEAAGLRLRGAWYWVRLVGLSLVLVASAALMATWAVRYYRYGWAG